MKNAIIAVFIIILITAGCSSIYEPSILQSSFASSITSNSSSTDGILSGLTIESDFRVTPVNLSAKFHAYARNGQLSVSYKDDHTLIVNCFIGVNNRESRHAVYLYDIETEQSTTLCNRKCDCAGNCEVQTGINGEVYVACPVQIEVYKNGLLNRTVTLGESQNYDGVRVSPNGGCFVKRLKIYDSDGLQTLQSHYTVVSMQTSETLNSKPIPGNTCAFSPDGGKIAFLSYENNNLSGYLYIYDCSLNTVKRYQIFEGKRISDHEIYGLTWDSNETVCYFLFTQDQESKTLDILDEPNGSVSLSQYDVNSGDMIILNTLPVLASNSNLQFVKGKLIAETVSYPSENPVFTGTEYSQKDEAVLYQVTAKNLTARHSYISSESSFATVIDASGIFVLLLFRK